MKMLTVASLLMSDIFRDILVGSLWPQEHLGSVLKLGI